MGRPLERFCKRGHDTHEVGRIRKGWCKACAQAADAAALAAERAKTMRREHRPTKPLLHDPEWERARVTRWLEIAAADPVPEKTGSVGRMKEFEARYKRLEAEVPTP